MTTVHFILNVPDRVFKSGVIDRSGDRSIESLIMLENNKVFLSLKFDNIININYHSYIRNLDIIICYHSSSPSDVKNPTTHYNNNKEGYPI